jgi:(p)ppGpp synthase/HD superfamily hydrolase
MKLPRITEDQLISSLKEKDLFTDLIHRAIVQAKRSHLTQKRDNGNPYLEEHIYPVAFDLIGYLESENKSLQAEYLIAGAILHDSIEDDPSFTPEICRKEFSDEIYDIIAPVTKSIEDNKSDLTQEEKFNINKKYVNNLEDKSLYSKLIKLSDKYNNFSSMFPLKGTERFDRYIKEVEEIYLPFSKEVSSYYYEKFLKRLNDLKNL